MTAARERSLKKSAVMIMAAMFAALVPAAGTAQVPDTACTVRLRSANAAGITSDLARIIDLQDTTAEGTWLVHRAGRIRVVNACAAPRAVSELVRALGTRSPENGMAILPAELLVVGNSAYPRDWNDGALWGGRGLNAALTAGATFRRGRFSAAVVPVFAWQSNAAYDIQAITDTSQSQSPFGERWNGRTIDAPQRFGASAFALVDAGQSYARLDVAGLGVGVSHENIVWGPARRNPLLLSATAPGFAHIFIETSRPFDIRIGELDVQMFWGRLTESEYFDSDPDNDHRMLAGVLVAFQPRIVDGLELGFGRLEALTWWPELSFSDVFISPYTGVRDNPSGRGGDNQLISLFFRWAVAPQGLEVYGEWGREDHWGEAVVLLRNLDASQAWTLGLQKFLTRGDNGLRLGIELTHLGDALPVDVAARPSAIRWYHNSSVRQGHTHRGQMLGAPIGTGAESLYIGADWFLHHGRSSLSFERVHYRDEAYLLNYAEIYGAHARDTEFSIRAGHALTFGALAVDAELGWSRRFNRDFLGLDDLAPGAPYRQDDNIGARIGLRWSR